MRLGLWEQALNRRVKADVLYQPFPARRDRCPALWRKEPAVQEKGLRRAFRLQDNGQGFSAPGAGVLHRLADELDAEAPLPEAGPDVSQENFPRLRKELELSLILNSEPTRLLSRAVDRGFG